MVVPYLCHEKCFWDTRKSTARGASAMTGPASEPALEDIDVPGSGAIPRPGRPRDGRCQRDHADGKDGTTYGASTTKEGQFITVFGPAMVRRGVGDPDLKSWYLPNSTAVGVLKLETHTSPKGSTATP